MDLAFSTIVAIIVVALVFDYINGFHDAANSIATVVSTRVLSPIQAVIWAAFFNFIALLFFGTGVAKTVGAGMVDLSVVTYAVILAGLLGAIFWNLITWYVGLPTSSSHALFGGYAGAAVAKAGFGAVIVSGWTKTLIFIVLAPLIGLTVGLLLMTTIYWSLHGVPPTRVDRWFRRMQLMSAAAYSLMHGANDAQKTMGIITGALVTGRYLHVVRSAALGRDHRAHGDRAWHAQRRLADHQDDGEQDHEAAAAGRIRGRDRRGHRDLHGDGARGRDQHDAHDHRRDRRRRRHAPAERRALGRRRADRLGLDPDDPRVGDDRRTLLLRHSAVRVRTTSGVVSEPRNDSRGLHKRPDRQRQQRHSCTGVQPPHRPGAGEPRPETPERE